MNYYARSANQNGKMETVQHHLARVADLCTEYTSDLGCPDAGEWMGLFHDLGKYSELFQGVLRGEEHYVDHALPGAVFLMQKLCGKSVNKSKCWPLVVCVRNHHCALQYDLLPEIKDWVSGEALSPDGKRYSISVNESRKALQMFLSENTLPSGKPYLPDFVQQSDLYIRKQQKMLFTRMLFSALTDADYSASAEHFDENYLKESSIEAFDPKNIWKKLQTYRENISKNSQADPSMNKIRDRLFQYCQKAGCEGKTGIYSLTAPTGSGKTLSMLAFGLQQMIHQGKKRIIIILPYLSIIEQNAAVYGSIIPDVLEDHSQAERRGNTARELSQRWDAPFIITTSVKFFESLFACTGPACRKLHRMADSVIIFDEAQSLPPQLARTTMTALRELAGRYRSTVMFSTATQPAYDQFPNFDWEPVEIVKDTQKMFMQTRRVDVRWRLDKPVDFEEIADEVLKDRNACVIVNLRKHAQKLYDLLCEYDGEENVFLLTTDLCPAHRTEMLKEIKRRLAEGKVCYLVSTQCIEAGVDISFDTMYRSLAPLESIIQSAGRCNRNDARKRGEFTVFLPNEENLYPDEFYRQSANAVLILAVRHEIDINSLSDIREYYKILFGSGTVNERKQLAEAINHMDFLEVAKEYRLIADTQYCILVPYGARREEFLSLAEEGRRGVTVDWMRRAAPLTVHSYQKDKIEQCCEALYVYEGKERMKKFSGWYVLSNPANYDDKKGLQLSDTFNGIL